MEHTIKGIPKNCPIHGSCEHHTLHVTDIGTIEVCGQCLEVAIEKVINRKADQCVKPVSTYAMAT